VVLLVFKSSILGEVSACPWDPKSVLLRLAKFLLKALVEDYYEHTILIALGSRSYLYTSSLWRQESNLYDDISDANIQTDRRGLFRLGVILLPDLEHIYILPPKNTVSPIIGFDIGASAIVTC
jgi:hypothetical protein